ncbi:MAG: hypothetical protein CENE_03260 [Candidatus Celerinatantimonas neptuna]|nr:MAG: hypothetical protein CENE_03260 [Candidatus Celerinatantimonas neptuna]
MLNIQKAVIDGLFVEPRYMGLGIERNCYSIWKRWLVMLVTMRLSFIR